MELWVILDIFWPIWAALRHLGPGRLFQIWKSSLEPWILTYEHLMNMELLIIDATATRFPASAESNFTWAIFDIFLMKMPSALWGDASVTGPILEALRYVPIPAVHARICRPRQPYMCEACLAYVLDPDSLRTVGSGRCVTNWTCHTYTIPCHQPDTSW